VLVSILHGLAATEIAITLQLRDYRHPLFLEFFNTIGAKRPFASSMA
jgi:hypothetical protein